LDAAIVICSTPLAREVYETLDGGYRSQTFSLRPGVLLNVFVEGTVWNSFMQTREQKE